MSTTTPLDASAKRKPGRPAGPCNAVELAQRRAAAGRPKPNVKPKRWKGEALEALKAAYETAPTLKSLVPRFYTSAGCIVRLASRHGWKRQFRNGSRSATPQTPAESRAHGEG